MQSIEIMTFILYDQTLDNLPVSEEHLYKRVYKCTKKILTAIRTNQTPKNYARAVLISACFNSGTYRHMVQIHRFDPACAAWDQVGVTFNELEARLGLTSTHGLCPIWCNFVPSWTRLGATSAQVETPTWFQMEMFKRCVFTGIHRR